MDLAQPAILIIDHDRAALVECASVLTNLGFRCLTVAGAEQALTCVAQDESIGVILVDQDLPGMPGIALIDRLKGDASNRPIISIIMAGNATLELAMSAIQLQVVGLLIKPLSHSELGHAAQRAVNTFRNRQWDAVGWRLDSVHHDVNELSRLLKSLKDMSILPSASRTDLKERDGSGDLEAEKRLLAGIISARRTRARYFNSALFADPAWDILLDLTVATLDDKWLAVSSVCVAANVPMSTALRWVRELVDLGLVLRQEDPEDRRRSLVRLPAPVLERMLSYLRYTRPQLT